MKRVEIIYKELNEKQERIFNNLKMDIDGGMDSYNMAYYTMFTVHHAEKIQSVVNAFTGSEWYDYHNDYIGDIEFFIDLYNCALEVWIMRYEEKIELAKAIEEDIFFNKGLSRLKLSKELKFLDNLDYSW